MKTNQFTETLDRVFDDHARNATFFALMCHCARHYIDEGYAIDNENDLASMISADFETAGVQEDGVRSRLTHAIETGETDMLFFSDFQRIAQIVNADVKLMTTIAHVAQQAADANAYAD